MKDIKKVANKYKEENGNDKLTQKDLLFYIIARLDDLEKSDSKQNQEIAKNKIKINIFWITLPIAITIAGFIGNLL
jgi:hypothetical protein